MDFLEAKEIGADIKKDFTPLKIGKGYDHCWVNDGWEKGKMIDEIVTSQLPNQAECSPSTHAPGVQIYTGNWLAGVLSMPPADAMTTTTEWQSKCRDSPDAPNKPEFPPQELRPGEEYRQTIRFAFSVR